MCLTTFVTSFNMELCDSSLESIAWRDHFAATFGRGRGVKVYIYPTKKKFNRGQEIKVWQETEC
jgi:hypothetical protein